MGLDLALGAIVLLAAIRGWLKGFFLQAIRLSGLVACVYLADPVRDQTKPYLIRYLPSIRPELSDRLFWWISAIASYFVVVALANLVVKLVERHVVGESEAGRNDQFAGFVLGACKGLISAFFLAAAVQAHSDDLVRWIPWAEEQVQTSKSLKWNAKYQPVTRIWGSMPVKHFVEQIRRHGLSVPSAPDEEADPKPLQATSSHAPRLAIPSTAPGDLDTTGLDAELARAVEAIQDELGRLATTPAN
jgi:uncharacterized membrane protein required for colicin V production